MSIKGYVLSVTSVVIISQICEMLLPSGRMKSATKMVFSLITILILVTPILTFFKTVPNIDFSDIESDVYIDQGFVEHAQKTRQKLLEERTEQALKSLGIMSADVDILLECENNVTQIKFVTINLQNSVILEGAEHINKTEVSQKVASALNIDIGRVKVID